MMRRQGRRLIGTRSKRHFRPKRNTRESATAGSVLDHEFGGWHEADVLQAADSISWLETNQDLAQKWVREGRCDEEWAREKHRWSFDRIRIERARELARPWYEEALAGV